MNPIQMGIGLYSGSFTLSPVDVTVMQALDTVQITETDAAPSGFQLRFRLDRSASAYQDYPIVQHPSLQPYQRIAVTVTIGGSTTVLMDGFILHTQLSPGPEGALFTVSGEDVSYAMDIIDLSIPYPAMPDAVIAALVLAKYMAIGVLPEIFPAFATVIPDPLEYTPQQNSSDRAYIRQLACKNAGVFYVEPLTLGVNKAYFGPSPRWGSAQPALSVAQAGTTNVIRLDFATDMSVARLVNGIVQDTYFTDMDLPITTFASTVPTLASQAALTWSLPFMRHSLFDHQGQDIIDATILAQSITDKSTWNPVTAEGELDAIRYGGVLRSRRLVAVRGAGSTHDGLYYVKSVTHDIRPGAYRQQFSLERGGLGTSIEEV